MKINIATGGSEDIIVKFGNEGSIDLMKARHDIAMNAIRNMKG